MFPDSEKKVVASTKEVGGVGKERRVRWWPSCSWTVASSRDERWSIAIGCVCSADATVSSMASMLTPWTLLCRILSLQNHHNVRNT